MLTSNTELKANLEKQVELLEAERLPEQGADTRLRLWARAVILRLVIDDLPGAIQHCKTLFGCMEGKSQKQFVQLLKAFDPIILTNWEIQAQNNLDVQINLEAKIILAMFNALSENRQTAQEGIKQLKHFSDPATVNNALAQYYCGECEYHGHGMQKSNITASISHYKKAAEQNNSDAANRLGIIYLNKHTGVKQNEVEALKWFEASAREGNIFAKANLANCYYKGIGGLKHDKKRAITDMTTLAEAGHASAQHDLAMYYYFASTYRKGVFSNDSELPDDFPDDEKVIEWMKRSAAQGFSLAQENLKKMKEAKWQFKLPQESYLKHDENLALNHDKQLIAEVARKVSQILTYSESAAADCADTRPTESSDNDMIKSMMVKHRVLISEHGSVLQKFSLSKASNTPETYLNILLHIASALNNNQSKNTHDALLAFNTFYSELCDALSKRSSQSVKNIDLSAYFLALRLQCNNSEILAMNYFFDTIYVQCPTEEMITPEIENLIKIFCTNNKSNQANADILAKELRNRIPAWNNIALCQTKFFKMICMGAHAVLRKQLSNTASPLSAYALSRLLTLYATTYATIFMININQSKALMSTTLLNELTKAFNKNFSPEDSQQVTDLQANGLEAASVEVTQNNAIVFQEDVLATHSKEIVVDILDYIIAYYTLHRDISCLATDVCSRLSQQKNFTTWSKGILIESMCAHTLLLLNEALYAGEKQYINQLFQLYADMTHPDCQSSQAGNGSGNDFIEKFLAIFDQQFAPGKLALTPVSQEMQLGIKNSNFNSENTPSDDKSKLMSSSNDVTPEVEKQNNLELINGHKIVSDLISRYWDRFIQFYIQYQQLGDQVKIALALKKFFVDVDSQDKREKIDEVMGFITIYCTTALNEPAQALTRLSKDMNGYVARSADPKTPVIERIVSLLKTHILLSLREILANQPTRQAEFHILFQLYKDVIQIPCLKTLDEVEKSGSNVLILELFKHMVIQKHHLVMIRRNFIYLNILDLCLPDESPMRSYLLSPAIYLFLHQQHSHLSFDMFTSGRLTWTQQLTWANELTAGWFDHMLTIDEQLLITADASANPLVNDENVLHGDFAVLCEQISKQLPPHVTLDEEIFRRCTEILNEIEEMVPTMPDRDGDLLITRAWIAHFLNQVNALLEYRKTSLLSQQLVEYHSLLDKNREYFMLFDNNSENNIDTRGFILRDVLTKIQHDQNLLTAFFSFNLFYQNVFKTLPKENGPYHLQTLIQCLNAKTDSNIYSALSYLFQLIYFQTLMNKDENTQSARVFILKYCEDKNSEVLVSRIHTLLGNANQAPQPLMEAPIDMLEKYVLFILYEEVMAQNHKYLASLYDLFHDISIIQSIKTNRLPEEKWPKPLLQAFLHYDKFNSENVIRRAYQNQLLRFYIYTYILSRAEITDDNQSGEIFEKSLICFVKYHCHYFSPSENYSFDKQALNELCKGLEEKFKIYPFILFRTVPVYVKTKVGGDVQINYLEKKSIDDLCQRICEVHQLNDKEKQKQHKQAQTYLNELQPVVEALTLDHSIEQKALLSMLKIDMEDRAINTLLIYSYVVTNFFKNKYYLINDEKANVVRDAINKEIRRLPPTTNNMLTALAQKQVPTLPANNSSSSSVSNNNNNNNNNNNKLNPGNASMTKKNKNRH